MPIPQDILSVPRPKNTVVIAYGKDKSLYAVRQRIGCRNDNGRHLPVNGPTIGHIIDGVYVPIDKEAPDSVSASSVDLKDWPTSSCATDCFLISARNCLPSIARRT